MTFIINTCIFFYICKISEVINMERIKNVIYILTNQQYTGYVKIGYASDLMDRLNTLNTGALIGFQVYGVLETSEKNADIQVHNIIGLLNPLLRARDLSGDKERSKEFFKLEASEAFELLKNIAAVFGLEDKVYKLVNNRREKTTYLDYNKTIKTVVKTNMSSTPKSYIISHIDDDNLVFNTRFSSYENFIYDLCKFCIKEYSLDLFKSVVLSDSSSYRGSHYFSSVKGEYGYYLKLSECLYLRLEIESTDVYVLTLANLLCETFNKVKYVINY